MKKHPKLIALALLPALLAGCSPIKATAPVLTASPVKQAFVSDNLTLLDGSTIATASGIYNYQSTGYPSVYGSETHITTAQTVLGSTKPSVTNQTINHDTGVKIYGSGTKTNVGSVNQVKIAASCPYFDFTDTNFAFPSAYESMRKNGNGICYLADFRFDVFRGSSRVFYAEAKSEDVTVNGESKTKYTYNRNGSTTSTTGNAVYNDNYVPFDFSKLGRIPSTLYSGSYTIRVIYSYLWVGKDSKGITGIMSTTATNNASLIIDYTKPTLSLAKSSDGKAIANGAYVNSAIKATASDTNLKGIYCKKPGYSYYAYTSGSSFTTGTANGTYSFYAVDDLGNQSDVVSATIDTIAPNGQLYANGKEVSSGSYVSTYFSYTASDATSGIANAYYKTPNSNGFVTYSLGTIVPSDSGDGWYEFYSVDKAGNQSDTLKIFLETGSPKVTIKRNGSEVYSHTMKESGAIETGLYFNEGDTIEFGYSSPSNHYSTGTFAMGRSYLLSKASYPNSTYSETITSATGISVTYGFSIVREKPTIRVNGTTYQSGAVIRSKDNLTIQMAVDSAVKNGATATVECDGATQSYDVLTNPTTTLSAKEGEDRTYSITIKDPAGNVSSFSVEIDKQPSSGEFLSNGITVANNGYTNKPFSFEFDSSDAKATYSKDGGAFSSYDGGILSEEGSYTFLLTDAVGNTSQYRITLDMTPPTGQLYAGNEPIDEGSVTQKAVYFTWDGDAECTVNGSSYARNTIIDSEGVYEFILTDKAGNKATYSIEIDRTAPTGNEEGLKTDGRYFASKWYECSFNGSVEAYLTYEEALDRASDLEFSANVQELNLKDIGGFTETGSIADNGDPDNHDDEVRTGEYWLYKSKSNPDIRLYYFDRNLLDDAIRQYAKSYVTGPHYFNGTNKPAIGVSDPMGTKDGVSAPIGNDYVLTNFGSKNAVAKNLSTKEETVLEYGKTLGEQLSDGLYEITETDRAGNSCTYQVIIDHSAPIMSATAEDYSGSKDITLGEESLPASGALYLKSFSVREILDSDKWSVVSVTTGEKTDFYTGEDELPTITEGGTYLIKAYDRSGNSISFTVYISEEEEAVSFRNNADDTAVSIDIAMPESYQAITSLEIYRNGTKLDGVSPDKLSYTFSKDGLYKVVLKDNFGKTLEKEYRFVKALPQGAITGVENGGKTANDVSFDYDSGKYYAEVYKDGALVYTDHSGSVAINASEENSGSYVIRLINLTDEENFQDYSFEIDKVALEVVLDGVEEKGTTNGSVTVSWSDSDVSSATYSKDGGEPVSFDSGTAFNQEGTYVIEVSDDMGNKTTKTFTIDKTVSYEVTTSSGRKLGGDATTSEDVIITADEEATITVLKDGKAYDYSFGDKLSEEGSYLITVEDAYGNKTSFTLVIDKSVDFTMNVGNGGVSNDPVVIESGESETIVVTRNGEAYDYKAGEEITEEGSYSAVITDAYGNRKEVSFQIVSSDAKQDIDTTLGEDAKVISVTKDGKEIPFDGNELTFAEDGTYVITYSSDGAEYTFTLTRDTTAPEVTLTGVENGGKVDGAVTIDGLTEEGTVDVYRDGKKIDYTLGDELKEYGHYEVVVRDALGNERTYTFDLAFQMNGWAIALIAVGVSVALGTVVAVILKRKKVYRK